MKKWKLGLAGFLAGTVNGLFGAGGGMALVPMLQKSGALEETEVFPSSVATILPLCILSIFVSSFSAPIPWKTALPYLLGSVPGGILAGLLGKKIPVKWLHRALGLIILWGGVRYLC